MKISIRKFIFWLILFGIALTPFLSIAEVYALLQGLMSDTSKALTPVYLKAMKDILFLFILSLGIIVFLKETKIHYFDKYFLVLILLSIASMLISFPMTTLMACASGIRWLLPLLLIPVIYRSVDTNLQNKINTIMVFILITSCILQVFQAIYFPSFFGRTFFGLNKRNPGIFLIPTSMAAFTMVSMFYCFHFSPNGLIKKTVLYLIGPLSIFLTGSGTGVLILMAFYLCLLYSKILQKGLFVTLTPLMLIVMIVIMPILVGRSHIYVSLLARVNIFLSNVLDPKNALISMRFGEATNTMVLVNTSSLSFNAMGHKGFIADSTLTSIACNVGFVALVVFALLMIKFVRQELIFMHFLVIFVGFMVSTIIFEMFPINLLFAVNLAYLRKIQNENQAYIT
ncbi:MAG: hypothetical protein PHW04_02925 [Candidatus Wallbacteria bacterium]|nr:hypothetical protein [Candidatus Wallbacteria bacterium]